MTIRERLDRVREQIAQADARRGGGPTKLVAVSKSQPPAAIREAYAAGQRVFGENYVQELVAKAEELADLDLEWHFIGHLQRNKVRDVLRVARTVQSVDRASLAQEASKRAPRELDVLLEVNVAREPQKSGVDPDALGDLVREVRALPNLRLTGLMAVPPAVDDPELTRPHFRALRALAEQLGVGPELSMGMSGDFVTAIEEGATMVRVGSSIFGARSSAR